VLSDPRVRKAEVEAWIERREAILDGLRTILVRSLRVPLPKHAIDPDVMLFGTGLALDSIDALELVVAAEEAFGVDLPDEEVEHRLRSLNSFVDLILAKQEQRA